MNTLTIDGKTVQCEAGRTLLEAALENNIEIPNLCYHPDLAPAGVCRLCLVEVEGRGRVVACHTPAENGMSVNTRTDEVQKIRRTALELLMAAHPATDLRKVAEQVGIEKERLALYRRPAAPHAADTSNPFFDFDPAKCILCGICVRTCDQVQGTHAIDFAFRGSKTTVSPFNRAPFMESRCESCGECVARCPVRALSFKGFEAPERRVNTLCPYCGVGCGVELGLRDNKIVNVSGNRKNPVNQGALCVKGRFGLGFVNSPGRLTQPLVRSDDENFRAVPWDEALALVAGRLKGIRNVHGPRALAGLASAKAANEENYLFQKFIRKEAGTNSVDHCARL